MLLLTDVFETFLGTVLCKSVISWSYTFSALS